MAKWLDFDIDDVAHRYLAGSSTIQLGRELGVRSTTVSKHLRRAGVAIRDGSGPRRRIPVFERIMRHTVVNEATGCWVCDLRPGAAYACLTRREGPGVTTLAHRIVYMLLVGPIPFGYALDHLCRVRRCVNPAHLEPVTIAENVLRGEGTAARHARQTHCLRGHPLSGDNLVVYGGDRHCRACTDIVRRRRALRRRSPAEDRV
jgi:hypothetical protein